MTINNLFASNISPPYLMDGAMGTVLQHTIKDKYKQPDILNLTDPSTIIDIHLQYIAAGSKIILTNTFGANRLRLAKSSASFKVSEINTAGVRLAQQAAHGTNVVIAGDIGPTGIHPSLIKDNNNSIISDVFKEQANYLIDAGVNLLILETFITFQEALIALTSIKDITSLPVIVLLSLQDIPKTVDGYTIEYAFQEFQKFGATSTGINCGNGAEQTLKLIQQIEKSTTLPITIKPNAGMPNIHSSGISYPEDQKTWSDYMVKIANFNIKFLGGCCGTTPGYLAELASRIQQRC